VDDLVTWLRAQLDEDERIAKATTERQPYDEWDAVGAGDDDDVARSHWEVVKIARMGQSPAARALAVHIAAHDPARVLREIDAKRRMIARVCYHGDLMDWDELHGDLLRLLAQPYADRPGYQVKWRP